MTRGSVIKKRRRLIYGFILYDETKITELVCRACKTDNDTKAVAVREKGIIKCHRCGKVCE